MKQNTMINFYITKNMTALMNLFFLLETIKNSEEYFCVDKINYSPKMKIILFSKIRIQKVY